MATYWRTRPLTGDELAPFVDAQHGWTWSGPTLLRAVNGGATWTRLPTTTPGGTALGRLEFVTAAMGFAFDAGTGLISRTVDGGQTWTTLPRPIAA